MNPQYELHIRKLTTQDLIPIIQKSQYSHLTNVIAEFNISGNDLVELKEYDVILKFGNNAKRKQFQVLLNDVQATPHKLFPLKPILKPPRRSSVINQSTLLLQKQQQVNDVLDNEPRPHLSRTQVNVSATSLKPVLIPKPSQTPKGPIEKKTVVRQFASPPIPSKPGVSGVFPNKYVDRAIPINRVKSQNEELDADWNDGEVSEIIPEYINTPFSTLPKHIRSGNHYDRTNQQSGNEQHSVNALLKPSQIKTDKQHQPKFELPGLVRQHQNRESFESSQNQYLGQASPNANRPIHLSQDLPEYINTATRKPSISRSIPDTHAEINQPSYLEDDIPEYVNTFSSVTIEDQLPEGHILNDPKRRQLLEDKLRIFIKQRDAAHQEHTEQEPEYYETEHDFELRKDVSQYDSKTSATPESFDSFDRSEQSSPIVVNEPPELPARPPELFKLGVIRKIKLRDSDTPPANVNANAIPEPQPVQSTSGINTTPPHVQNIYGKLPSIPNNKPIIPPDDEISAETPDDNEYVIPVTLRSPQYVLRRIKFFREVTREEGFQILNNRPVGTFLLRHSKTHLGVLMFIGASMVNHVPICHDDFTDEFFLASQPGTTNPNKFKCMMKLLDFYSRYPITANDKILHHEVNNID